MDEIRSEFWTVAWNIPVCIQPACCAVHARARSESTHRVFLALQSNPNTQVWKLPCFALPSEGLHLDTLRRHQQALLRDCVLVFAFIAHAWMLERSLMHNLRGGKCYHSADHPADDGGGQEEHEDCVSDGERERSAEGVRAPQGPGHQHARGALAEPYTPKKLGCKLRLRQPFFCICASTKLCVHVLLMLPCESDGTMKTCCGVRFLRCHRSSRLPYLLEVCMCTSDTAQGACSDVEVPRKWLLRLHVFQNSFHSQ